MVIQLGVGNGHIQFDHRQTGLVVGSEVQAFSLNEAFQRLSVSCLFEEGCPHKRVRVGDTLGIPAFLSDVQTRACSRQGLLRIAPKSGKAR